MSSSTSTEWAVKVAEELKGVPTGNIRRFSLASGPVFSDLTSHVSSLFGTSVVIKYLDPEGDKITVASQEELDVAIATLPKAASGTAFRLIAEIGSAPSARPSPAAAPAEAKTGCCAGDKEQCCTEDADEEPCCQSSDGQCCFPKTIPIAVAKAHLEKLNCVLASFGLSSCPEISKVATYLNAIVESAEEAGADSVQTEAVLEVLHSAGRSLFPLACQFLPGIIRGVFAQSCGAAATSCCSKTQGCCQPGETGACCCTVTVNCRGAAGCGCCAAPEAKCCEIKVCCQEAACCGKKCKCCKAEVTCCGKKCCKTEVDCCGEKCCKAKVDCCGGKRTFTCCQSADGSSSSAGCCSDASPSSSSSCGTQ